MDLSKRFPQEMRVSNLRFLDEQDGEMERLLKNHLASFFNRDRSVLTAYLVRVSVSGSESVALCLTTQFGPDRGLAEKIGLIFKTIFNEKVFLDIIFLSNDQVEEVSKISIPFYTSEINL